MVLSLIVSRLRFLRGCAKDEGWENKGQVVEGLTALACSRRRCFAFRKREITQIHAGHFRHFEERAGSGSVFTQKVLRL